VNPTGLEPAPKTYDTEPYHFDQLKKPLIHVNRDSSNDLDMINQDKIQLDSKINPVHPTGLEPAPKTYDTEQYHFDQLKKPLIHVNRDSSNDLDMINQDKIQLDSKIDPTNPTGLEPAPKTVDTEPYHYDQLKKPLIMVNWDDKNDYVLKYDSYKLAE
jgi:hypothetical protein